MLHIRSRRGLVDMGPGGARRAGGRWPVAGCFRRRWHGDANNVSKSDTRQKATAIFRSGCNWMQPDATGVCYYIILPVHSCFHMFSRMAGYGNESSWLRSTISHGFWPLTEGQDQPLTSWFHAGRLLLEIQKQFFISHSILESWSIEFFWASHCV